MVEGDVTLTDQTIDEILFVDGTIRIRSGVRGVGTLIATRDIRVDTVAGQPVELDKAGLLSLIALDDIRVGKGSSLRGALRAGRDVMVEKESRIDGVAVADRNVHVDKDARVTFLVFDATPPEVHLVSPEDQGYTDTAAPAILLSFFDDASDIQVDGVRFLLDGQDRTADSVFDETGLSFIAPQPLAEGPHTLELFVADGAGNVARAHFTFTVDTLPPELLVAAPEEGELVGQVNLRVTGTVRDATPIRHLAVAGQPAELSGESFSGFAALNLGPNSLKVEATDSAGNHTSTLVSVGLDAQPPRLSLSTPRSSHVTNDATIRLAGEVDDNTGVEVVQVNGVALVVTAGSFDEEVSLAEGLNVLLLQAVDLVGNVAELRIEVRRVTPPSITIDSPASLSLARGAFIEVKGTVDDPGAKVWVNGRMAALDGHQFIVADLPVVEGRNIIDAIAVDDNGLTGTAKATVFHDRTPPRVTIYEPVDGTTTHQSEIAVHGLVNELRFGSARPDSTAVTVNGVPARVSNRSFLLERLALEPGDNVITVTAVDPSGNVGESTVRIHLEPPRGKMLQVDSGNYQSAVIGEALARPLAVLLRDEAGDPASGVPVVFRAVDNNGRLSGGLRHQVVSTDAEGRAEVAFTLGTRAGVANQRVEASAAGYRGTAVFLAEALPGDPVRLFVDSGDQQVGVTGRILPDPLVLIVTDRGFNPVEGVPVVFRVVKGEGRFANSQPEIVIESDRVGRASATLRLDSDEGVANNVVVARLADSPELGFVTFVASGLMAGDPAETSVRGVVLDNTDSPLPGVSVTIRGTDLETRTDAQGLFRLGPAPVGTIVLDVEGDTTSRSGTWPKLEFEMTTVPGRNNTMGRPVYLLPLDVDRGLHVSETEGGTLTLPELPGFSLEIAPGSATFTDGSRDGVISATLVHSDKVPMTPSSGQQPQFVVTIQPGGTRFDPPARLTLPNVDGLEPGEVIEMFSFDHDLGSFVSIGPGTVSADGVRIVSNPGVGVLEAGWHCGSSPATAGTTHDCPECQVCDGSTCVPGCSIEQVSAQSEQDQAVFASTGDSTCSCTGNKPCRFNYRCENGRCVSDKVEVDSIEGPCVVAVNAAARFEADSNKPDQVRWRAPRGFPTSGLGETFVTLFRAKGRRKVRAGCGGDYMSTHVEVVNPCDEIDSKLKEAEVPGPDVPTKFGRVTSGFRQEAEYRGCGDGSKYCFRLEKYTETHSFFVTQGVVNGIEKVDISGADDTDVTPETCAAIIADLTPPPPGSGVGPIRRRYWSRKITTAHEREHVNNTSLFVTPRVFENIKSFVQSAERCTRCKSAIPEALFNSMLKLFLKLQIRARRPVEEKEAHNVSNPMYNNLIQDIRNRAREAPSSENWPDSCK